jgi:ribonuclease-3
MNNERLEFLGDSILGASCATLLYEKFPEKAEGELAKIKSVTVCEEVLAAVALVLQIDAMLLFFFVTVDSESCNSTYFGKQII